MDHDLRYQLYRLDNENKVNVVIREESIWLTQKSMSELFAVGQPAIAKHLKNIFESGELDENQVYSKVEYTANSIDEFLKFRRYKILNHKGRVSMKQAKDKAHLEYGEFNKIQKVNSDFEKEIEKLQGRGKMDE